MGTGGLVQLRGNPDHFLDTPAPIRQVGSFEVFRVGRGS